MTRYTCFDEIIYSKVGKKNLTLCKIFFLLYRKNKTSNTSPKFFHIPNPHYETSLIYMFFRPLQLFTYWRIKCFTKKKSFFLYLAQNITVIFLKKRKKKKKNTCASKIHVIEQICWVCLKLMKRNFQVI